MYQNYIFDLYGTLLAIHTNENKSYLWEKMADFFTTQGAYYQKEELRTTYRKHCARLQANSKNPNYELDLFQVFSYLYSKKKITVSDEKIQDTATIFRILSRSFLYTYPGVLEFLELLKKKNKQIFLLSNAQRCFTYAELVSTNLLPYFDGIVISSDVAYKKPDVQIMNTLLNQYQLNIANSIMIGNDKYADIAIANAVQMDSVYIHTAISPKNDPAIHATHEIPDGDFTKLAELLLS